MKRTFVTGAALIASLMAVNSSAQLPEEDAQDAVDQRRAVFHLMAFSNSPLGQMARGAEYDEEAAIKGTERIITLAKMIPEVFEGRDTRENDVETRALDSIWDNMDDFEGLADDLVEGAESALAILEEEGESGVRNAIREIGPKCGACHDRFRAD